MIKHIYIQNKTDLGGTEHGGPMLCGAPPQFSGQYSISVYERGSYLFKGDTWCPQCEEKTDLAILATTDLGDEGQGIPGIPQPPPGLCEK